MSGDAEGKVHRRPRHVPVATPVRHDQSRSRRAPRTRVHPTPDVPGVNTPPFPVACTACPWTDVADTREQVTELRRAHFDAEHLRAALAVHDPGDVKP